MPQQLRHGQPLTPLSQAPLMFSAPTRLGGGNGGGGSGGGGDMLFGPHSQSVPNPAMLVAAAPALEQGGNSRTQSPGVNALLQVGQPPLQAADAACRLCL